MVFERASAGGGREIAVGRNPLDQRLPPHLAKRRLDRVERFLQARVIAVLPALHLVGLPLHPRLVQRDGIGDREEREQRERGGADDRRRRGNLERPSSVGADLDRAARATWRRLRLELRRRNGGSAVAAAAS